MWVAEVVTAPSKKNDLSGNTFKADCHASERPLKTSWDCVKFSGRNKNGKINKLCVSKRFSATNITRNDSEWILLYVIMHNLKNKQTNKKTFTHSDAVTVSFNTLSHCLFLQLHLEHTQLLPCRKKKERNTVSSEFQACIPIAITQDPVVVLFCCSFAL